MAALPLTARAAHTGAVKDQARRDEQTVAIAAALPLAVVCAIVFAIAAETLGVWGAVVLGVVGLGSARLVRQRRG